MNADERGLTTEAQRETSRGDVPGGEVWPMADAASMGAAPAPPVGLNWTSLAQALHIDVDVLRHDGSIIVIGETFPEDGYFFDPVTFQAQVVDVGQRALTRGYFLGRVAADTHELVFDVDDHPGQIDNPVVRADSGSVIALFADRDSANRATTLVMRGSLGSGVTTEDGPLGPEVTVSATDMPGRVATTLASLGGAILSVGGNLVLTNASPALATNASSGVGDARRSGTGVTSDVRGTEKSSPPPGH
jgi:hypothetical protein